MNPDVRIQKIDDQRGSSIFYPERYLLVTPLDSWGSWGKGEKRRKVSDIPYVYKHNTEKGGLFLNIDFKTILIMYVI